MKFIISSSRKNYFGAIKSVAARIRKIKVNLVLKGKNFIILILLPWLPREKKQNKDVKTGPMYKHSSTSAKACKNTENVLFYS